MLFKHAWDVVEHLSLEIVALLFAAVLAKSDTLITILSGAETAETHPVLFETSTCKVALLIVLTLNGILNYFLIDDL